jgi:hypothetical protein
VPYVFTGRTAGESKMNAREALGYLKQLLALAKVRFATGARPRPRYVRVSPDDLRAAVPAVSEPS